MKFMTVFLIFILMTGILSVLADEKELPTIPDTKVTIPWKEFKSLIERAMAADTAKVKPPRDYVIQTARYIAKPDADELEVEVLFVVNIPEKKWVKIKLFDAASGLKKATLNNKNANIVIDGGYSYLITNKKGTHKLRMTIIKKGRGIQNGTSVSLTIPEVALSTFEIDYPGEDFVANINPSIETEVKSRYGKTTIKSIIPATSYITIEWMKPVPEGEKIEPKIYSEVYTLLSLGEGRLNVSSKIVYSILKGSAKKFTFSIPIDASVASLNGGEYTTEAREGEQIVEVLVPRRVTGEYTIFVNYEINLGKTSATFLVPELQVYNVEREKGWIGVSAFTTVEIKTVNVSGDIEMVDIKELPQVVWSISPNPILVGFKYIKHPYSVTLELTTHENLPVLVATIDNASYTTLLTDEGKMVTRAIYTVRNNLKQFIRLLMPKGTEIWGSFVSERPAKPTKGDKDNEVLIQLERSIRTSGEMESFTVEVIYFERGEILGKKGEKKIMLPQVDIPISELTWSLWLPDEYKYGDFGGNVKEWKPPPAEGDISGLLTSSPMTMVAGKKVEKEKAAYEENIAYQQQVQAEEDFMGATVRGGRAKGALPVRISIPARGEFKRFSKLLVTDETPELIIKYGKGGGCLFF